MTDPKAHLTKHDLKNKANLPDRQIDAISVIIMVYGNVSSWCQRKNKANLSIREQTQFSIAATPNKRFWPKNKDSSKNGQRNPDFSSNLDEFSCESRLCLLLMQSRIFFDYLFLLFFFELDQLFSEVFIGQGQDLYGENGGVFRPRLSDGHCCHRHAGRHLEGA